MRRFRRSELKSGNERHWSGRGNFELNQLSTEYECLNQLIHYWYCCAAGKHLTTPSLDGQSIPRWDIPSKVDGSAKFGIDVTVPGMLVAALRP
jgi:hypothetical protein